MRPKWTVSKAAETCVGVLRTLSCHSCYYHIKQVLNDPEKEKGGTFPYMWMCQDRSKLSHESTRERHRKKGANLNLKRRTVNRTMNQKQLKTSLPNFPPFFRMFLLRISKHFFFIFLPCVFHTHWTFYPLNFFDAPGNSLFWNHKIKGRKKLCTKLV